MTMTRITRAVCIFMLAVLVSACATQVRAPQYFVGQKFEGAFTIGIWNTTVPLPEGEWTLIGYQQTDNDIMTDINEALLIQTDGNDLSRFIEVFASNGATHRGYEPSSFCKRDNILHIVKRVNIDGGKQDCWGINHWRMTLSKDASAFWKQGMEYIAAKKIQVPINALIVKYRKANKKKFVQVLYGFNPELEGFAPPTYAAWSSSDWHRDRYYTDDEKVKYIDTLKSWGTSWDSRVTAGFEGDL